MGYRRKIPVRFLSLPYAITATPCQLTHSLASLYEYCYSYSALNIYLTARPKSEGAMGRVKRLLPSSTVCTCGGVGHRSRTHPFLRNGQLREALQDKDYVVQSMLPTFVVVVAGSAFEKALLARHNGSS